MSTAAAMDKRNGTRGAALLITVAMLAVLTAVALYLYSASRLEWRIATAHRDNVQAQFLADAGLAMAQSILREDLERHPLVTSSDHPWKSYFNGAWWARKAWAYDRDDDGNIVSVPYNLDTLPPEWKTNGQFEPANPDDDNYVRTSGVPKIYYTDLLEMARRTRNLAAANGAPITLDEALDDVLIPRRDPVQNPDYIATRYDFAADNVNPKFEYWRKNLRFATPERVNPPLPWYAEAPAPNRASSDWDAATNPYLTEAETIHRWADVDLDGDGLRDAMWIPIPIDRIANEDGIDNDLDGLVDEGPGMGSDGWDNDGDGEIDEEDEQNPPDNLDNDGDGFIDEEDETNIVPSAETAVFVYYGGNDGLDNDGDGEIDETDEQTLFLTAPFYDQFGNDITADFVYPGPVSVRLGEETVDIGWAGGTPAVDVLDNDHSLIINDARGYIYPIENQNETQLAQEYRRVDAAAYFPGRSGEILTFSGEPVSDIAGRVAVLVTDESSKANLNASHGLAMRSAMDAELDGAGNVIGTADWQNVMTRAMNEGLGVHELDLRVYNGLGGLDTPNLTNMTTLRLGYPTGQGYGVYNYWQDGSGTLVESMLPETPADMAFRYDLSLPGYGFTDDNGDAFWAAFDGLDNDGDGFIDEGVQLVEVDPNLRNYYDTNENGWDDRSEALEGIDEPTEYRQFRPYRNRLAETDGVNNDSLDIDYVDDDESFYAQNTDELGEFGDQYYRTRAEIKRVKDIAGARYEALAPYVTVHSADRNDRYVVKERDADGLRFDVARPELSGLRLDYNYAVADQIFNALVHDWAYDPLTFPDLDATRANFAQGLRSGADTFVAEAAEGGRGLLGFASTGGGLGGELGADYLPADPELRAAQLAVNAEDNRDLNHSRTELRTSAQDEWWDEITGEDTNRRIEYVTTGAEDIRINEIMVRATRRVEAEALITDDDDYEDLDFYPETIKATADWNQQFNPNLFSAGLDGRADFDYAKRGIPVDRIVGADVTINDPRFGVGGEVDWWYGRPSGTTGGQPYGPSVGVLGRPGAGNDYPEPAHIGEGAYVGFQAPVPTQPQEDIGTASYSEDPVSATRLNIEVPNNSGGVTEVEVPNLVQFRFGPSPQLPPGRYYLLANMSTTGNAGDTTLYKGHTWDRYADAYNEVDDAGKMKFLMKYGPEDGGILEDATATNGRPFLDLFGTAPAEVDSFSLEGAGVVRSPIVGTRRAPDPRGEQSDGVEVPTGMVFLPGLKAPVQTADFPPDLLREPELRAAYGQSDAYFAGTVVIPPYADDPNNQQYLYLAVWKDGEWIEDNPTRPTDLAINYFEFSQEPDHEWVELVNTGTDTVDVRGWTLEVGQFGDVNLEDDHIVFTIGKPRDQETDPDEDEQERLRSQPIEIAPGGSLILAVNKFDVGADEWNETAWPPDFGPLFRNGIGLCASDDDAMFPLFGTAGTTANGISIPPFPPVSPDTNEPVTDSVFYRPEDSQDFIDRNGNGIADDDADEVDWVRAGWEAENNEDTGARSSLDSDYPPDMTPLEGRDRSWDRVVQLYSDSIRYASGLEEGSLLLDRILNGGVFPNTPDEDWVDNDHDSAALEDSQPGNTLGGDGLDNDGDGLVDEKTGMWLDAGPDDDDLPVYNEGTDEGRFRREARRDARIGALPGSALAGEAAVAGAGHEEPVPANIGQQDSGQTFALGAVNYDFVYQRTDARNEAYTGAEGDPPAWKDYVERRMYPGDCVFVTLYEGAPSTGRIVDRVTYNQNDVENASFQDVSKDPATGALVTCPYTDEQGAPATLYANDGTTWPENTMGVDFYRTLERKHPLYPGDRHGTQNRWEATDGNYDDWHGGQGPWFLGGDPDSPTLAGWVQDDEPVVQYAHAVAGSPLRQNFFARGLEAPIEDAADDDPRDTENYFSPAGTDQRPIEVGRDPAFLPYWHFQRDSVRNRTYSSPGELVRMPHSTYVAAVAPMGTAPAVVDRAHNVLVGRGEDLAGGRIDPKVDVDALVTTGTAASIVLTAGQADFYPIAPSPVNGEVMDLYTAEDYADLVRWENEGGAPPLGWTPVFLRNFDDGTPGEVLTETYGPMDADVQLNFLLNAGVWRGDWETDDFVPFEWQVPLGVFSANMDDRRAPNSVVPLPYAATEEGRDAYWQSLRGRWPLEKRAVMYVAANAASFEPTNYLPDYRETINYPTDAPAEALFTWDGDDGVRNGPYDVYIITADRLDRLDNLTDEAKSALLFEPGEGQESLSGAELLEAARRSDPSTLGVTVEVFTDRDGNRRVWDKDQWPTPVSLNAARDSESFGMLAAVEPTPDGVVYYGQVEVENNYLGLFLRNWGRAGALNRFSRVILAAPRHTPGRININTVETKIAGARPSDIGGTEVMAEGRLVNPLAGMPGMLAYNFDAEEGTAYVPNDRDGFDGGEGREDSASTVENMLNSLEPPLNRSDVFNDYGNGYDAALWRAEQLVTGVPRSMVPPWSQEERFLGGRPWHVDGRYYRTIADVVVRGIDGGADLEFPDLEAQGRLVFDTQRLDGEPANVFGPEARYDEKVYRFSRIANLVTTRSDTFEIIVRAQSGGVSGNDINGDGRVDYRNDFVPTQEKQVRTIYNR